jgi:cobyrinic acid a,c-diamide synthase
MITKQTVAERIGAYVHHQITLEQLVDWAEQAMMDGEFNAEDATDIRDVVARLGVADVRAFGLTWDDCEELLGRLGYKARIEIIAN